MMKIDVSELNYSPLLPSAIKKGMQNIHQIKTGWENYLSQQNLQFLFLNKIPWFPKNLFKIARDPFQGKSRGKNSSPKKVH